MKQKFIKVINEDGTSHIERSRDLTLIGTNPNQFGFKDQAGNIVEPTELELELFNELQTGGIKIQNGWLTFIGIIMLLNLILEIILLAKLFSPNY